MKRNVSIGWQVLGILALLVLAATGASANSNTISYQGVLRDAALAPVADGTYQMRFSIFAVASGGASVWGPETQSVATRNGMFSVYLGNSPVFGTVFADNAALWLQVEVDFGGGAGFEVYNPRVPLASVPYARQAANADTVGGVSAAGLAAQMDSKVSAHDSSTGAHADIRTKIGTDIGNHNTSVVAHDDIRTKIGTDIGTHNTSGSAHNDIRTQITTSIAAHNSAVGAHSFNVGPVTGAHNTFTTVYTFPNVSEMRMWMVTASLSFPTGDAPNYSGWAIIATDVGSSRLMISAVGNLYGIQMSGLNLQLRQNSGVPQPLVATIMRLK